jgi:FkbM family methyltransferase
MTMAQQMLRHHAHHIQASDSIRHPSRLASFSTNMHSSTPPLSAPAPRTASSLIYRALCALTNAALRRAGIVTHKTHTFAIRNLGPDSVVVDLGANVGDFASALDSECYALEPVPHLFDAIPSRPKLHKLPYAISSQCEPVTIHLSENRECNSIDQHISEASGLGEKVVCRGVTLESFLVEQQLVGRVSLLKVDIEGAEKQLFASTSDDTLRSLPQISIEFHDFVPGSPDRPFVTATIERLRGLGFFFLPYSYLMPGAEHADVLFIQPKKCGLLFGDRAWLAFAVSLLRLQKLKADLRARFFR